MRQPLILAAIVVALLSLVAAGTAGARVVTTQTVKGRLTPTDDESDAAGGFRIALRAAGTKVRESFDLAATGLDVTKDDDGNLPSCHAFLVTADGGAEADFGEVFLSPRGGARVRFRSARESFPSGVETLADFAGGTVELRLGDDVILTGDVPDFLGVADENGAGSGARATAAGASRLVPTRDHKGAKGVVSATYANRPKVQVEAFRVECVGLGRIGDTFTVVVIDGESNETELGAMRVRTRLGFAVLALSTRRGDTIPGDGVLSFGGQTVEVRDSGGNAWLQGRFPALSGE